MTECIFEIEPGNPRVVRCVRFGCNRRIRAVEGCAPTSYHAECHGTRIDTLAKASAEPVTVDSYCWKVELK